MIKKLLLLMFLSTGCLAQVGPPPPAGCNVFWVVDTENDGYVQFDIPWYINYVSQLALVQLNHDLSGYTKEFYADDNDFTTEVNIADEVSYTNIIQFQQQCSLRLIYTGSGPEYNHADLEYHHGCHVLKAVPFDGDFDQDGISNADEDTNGNLNLMDDDEDNDGHINYYDPSGALDTAENTVATFHVSPNPVTEGFFNITSSVEKMWITAVDATGKKVFEEISAPGRVDIGSLAPGLYFFRFESDTQSRIVKILIK